MRSEVKGIPEIHTFHIVYYFFLYMEHLINIRKPQY